MKNKKPNRILFIEIYIAALLFLMTAITCFLGITKAGILQKNADMQTLCANITENAAEVILSSSDENDAYEKLKQEFHACITNGIVQYEYDGLSVAIKIKTKNNFIQADITVYDSQTQINTLSIVKTLGETVK